jgi:type IV/VI secretion system ImpK/VasF family protein
MLNVEFKSGFSLHSQLKIKNSKLYVTLTPILDKRGYFETASKGSKMKNSHWEAIHEVYTKLEKLCGRSLYTPKDTHYAADDETGQEGPVQPGVASDGGPDVDDLVNVRSELRTKLDFLKAALEEQYSERDTYLVLFPIVAQIDELIQTNFLEAMQTSWPLLQKELFQIDNAGEVFYEILDDILLKPQTPLFVFEVYYFCLDYGFRGRYESNPVKLTEYIKKLQTKLQQEKLAIAPVEEEEMGRIGNFGSPYLNYLITAGALVGVYLLLLILGRYV